MKQRELYLSCVFFSFILIPFSFLFCSSNRNTDFGLNTGEDAEVYVITGTLGDLEFYRRDDEPPPYEYDTSRINGYYELTWSYPVIDSRWQIACYVWHSGPLRDFPDFTFRDNLGNAKTIEEYIHFFDTAIGYLREYPVLISSKTDADMIIPTEYGATCTYDNTLRIHLGHPIDTAYSWPPYYPDSPQYPVKPDTTFVVNRKIHYWDHREFKVVLTKPSTVVEY